MQIGTIVRLGSLAFGVVNNEKVQELWKMAHKGVKRRGMLQPPSNARIAPPPLPQRRPGSRGPRGPYW